ncbi:MAG: response regulator [Bermanella sp.]
MHSKKIDILIVGDNHFNMEEVVRLSSSPAVVIHQAADSEWAIGQFDRSPCHVLILCHSQVADAENFYNSFIMFSERAMETPHQTLLLCDGKDSARAHEVCSQQGMDDYVIYKPLYDINRIKFSISLAMDRLESRNYKNVIENRLTNMVENISNIKTGLSLQLDKVNRCQQSMINQNISTDEILDKGISRIKKKLERLHGDGVIEIGDQRKFSEEYNRIKKECLQESKEQLTENKHLSMMESIKSDVSEVHDSASSILEQQKNEIEGKPWKVLVVEDEAVNQKMMGMMLDREGFMVKVASDGISAINIAEDWAPHVILMDIKMPKMNGLKVTQRLKSNKKFRDTHIIMLTGHSEQAVVRECLKAGASDFIVKPAKKDELLERISSYCAQEVSQ